MNKFLRLTWRDKWIVLQALWMLIFIRTGLKIWGYQVVRNRITAQCVPQQINMNTVLHIGKLANSVAAQLGGNCLHRSLVVWWVLRRQGVESSLHFGIPRQQSTKFIAHVWVQIDDTIINDSTAIHASYTELTSASDSLQQECYNFG